MYVNCMYTNRVFGIANCVLLIEVSSFQGVLIREVTVLRGETKKEPFRNYVDVLERLLVVSQLVQMV